MKILLLYNDVYIRHKEHVGQNRCCCVHYIHTLLLPRTLERTCVRCVMNLNFWEAPGLLLRFKIFNRYYIAVAISNGPNMCNVLMSIISPHMVILLLHILNNKKYVVFGDDIYTIYFQLPLRKSLYLKVTMYRTTIQRYNIK